MKNLYLLLFIISFTLAAQVEDTIAITTTQELRYDLDSVLTINKFDPQQVAELQKEDNFKYIEYKEPNNWWTQLKEWLNQLFNRFTKWLFGVDEITGFWAVILKLLPYLIIIGLFFLLKWLFQKVNPSEILLEKTSSPELTITEDEDIIQNQNIQQLIERARSANNYRLAIRYYYLLALKNLSDSELIQWEAQKTNADYAIELPNTTIKNQFKVITRLYDFIWYGSFEVDEQAYRQAEKEFQSITNLIPS